MTEIIKQSARALLFDSEQRLVLIKRTKPQQEPYWVTVGGGVETDDVSVEAALHREIREELGGRIDQVRRVLLITDDLPGGIGIQHVFTARLTSMDLANRTGTEFNEPGRGTYEVLSVPATRDALTDLRLLPLQLAEFARANVHGLLALVNAENEVDEVP
ncbi:NUDIX hydrolase [Nocardiopsis sp. ARC36]